MTQREARTLGKSVRDRLPRKVQGRFVAPDRDAVDLLDRQNATRVPELVPVRFGRMLESPFAFYRGSAALMAHDLGRNDHSDILVVSCGDAHVSNFGLYASPERALLFDLNDFDEGGYAPWEWDLKRLAASVHIGGRANGFSETTCGEMVRSAVASYVDRFASMLELTVLERSYVRVDTAMLQEMAKPRHLKDIARAESRARRRTSEQVVQRLVTTGERGARRIIEQPPITTHVIGATSEQLGEAFRQYHETLPHHTALLLSQFELQDAVHRVVGVGSVGTRAYLAYLEGPNDEPLILQAKEADRSVLASFGGMPDRLPPGVPLPDGHSQGQRVVAVQRILQAASDHFLGWITFAGHHRRVDYYWRQFRDMKGSVDLATLDSRQFTDYARLCAWLLARAHVQSPNAAVVGGYIGRSDALAEPLAQWAARYADQAEADYAALVAAVDQGRVPAERGV